MQRQLNRPDEAAMLRVLDREKWSVSAVMIRLAWELGLTREEIRQLKWSSISFADRQLVLEDRTIPMEEETARCLETRFHYRGHLSEFVANGDRNREQLQAPSISRLVRRALDAEETLQDVSLKDLRNDFIIRQLSLHEWPYVARISGMTTNSMYTLFSEYMTDAEPAEDPAAETPAHPDEFLVWKIVQAEGTSAEGLALWMSWKYMMSAQEIISLTWENILFDPGVIRLADRDILMDNRFRRQLQSVRDTRTPEDDPHVMLTPRSKRPFDSARLSKAMRTLFIRHGAEQLKLHTIITSSKRSSLDRKLLQLITEKGGISRNEVAEQLQISSDAAHNRLRRLVSEGEIVRVDKKYYLPNRVVLPEQQYESICRYLDEAGSAYLQDLAELLGIEKRQCSYRLKKLVQEGKLIQIKQRYSLPLAEEA